MKNKRTNNYSVSTKRDVIKLYHKSFSSKEIEERIGMSSGYIKNLCRKYDLRGESSLHTRKIHCYSQEYKLSIIQEVSKKILSLNGASLKYDIPQSSIHNWLEDYRKLGECRFLQLKSAIMKKEHKKDIKIGSVNKTCKKGPHIKLKKTDREKELEKELEIAHAEIAYLKKWRALIQKEEMKERNKR